MRIVLLEPRLKKLAGHFATYVVALARAASGRSVDVRVLANRRLKDEARAYLVAHGIDPEPVFHEDWVRAPRIRALTWPLASAEYARVLWGALREADSDGVVFAPTAEPDQVAGALTAVLVARRPEIPVVMQFFTWDWREGRSRTRRLIRGYKRATEAWLRRQAGGPLIVVGQTPPVAQHIAQRLSRPIASLPMTLDWSLLRPKSSLSLRPRVGFLGDTRPDKGFKQFLQAASRLDPGVEVVFQRPPAGARLEPGLKQALAAVQKRSRCQIHPAIVSQEEYADLAASLDVVALPYVPAIYRNRTSNVLAEAFGLNIVPVIPGQTWMSEMADSLGVGVVYDDYSAAGLGAALSRAVEDREELFRRSSSVSAHWRRENSAEACLDALMRMCR